MAKLIQLKNITDKRGNLCVVEGLKDIPFEIKRVFYMYGVPNTRIERGGHRHKKTRMLLIPVHGSCEVNVEKGEDVEIFALEFPEWGLLLEPEDWHTMTDFRDDAVLLVLASEYFDADDYIDEKN